MRKHCLAPVDTPPREPGLQAERTRLAGTRTALSMAAAALALLHAADPPAPVTVALVVATSLCVAVTILPALREARGLRLASLTQLSLMISLSALVVIVTG
ncbi:hypothetical protein NBCG_01158 [Nocardioidaceae bacterium Broad-1]|nr:hypothetical protein NBCG_01158 [Nocardioidaceae bacterium Broad-1]